MYTPELYQTSDFIRSENPKITKSNEKKSKQNNISCEKRQVQRTGSQCVARCIMTFVNSFLKQTSVGLRQFEY